MRVPLASRNVERINHLKLVRHLARLIIALVVLAGAGSETFAQHRAIAVAAAEPALGVNVLRDDGRVISFTMLDEVEGPVLIPGLERIVAITPRMALREDGVVLTWEPSCDGTGAPAASCDFFENTHEVRGLHDVVAISEANRLRLALDRNGAVWGWGNDEDGLISGLPPLDRQKKHKARIVEKPTRIPLPVPMAKISAGYVQAGAIDRDGHVWTWGGDRFPADKAQGERFVLPNGLVAIRVDGLSTAASLDMSSSPYVLTKAGEIWRWGGFEGATGNVDTSMPIRVSGVDEATAVSQGNNFVAILTKDGSVLYIGSAPDDRNFASSPKPRATRPLPAAIAISGAARIMNNGAAVHFLVHRPGVPKSLDLGQ